MNGLVLARKAFRDAKVTVIAGGLLSFSLALMYVSLFPSVQETLEEMELPEYMENLSGAGGGYSTPAGYLSGEYFLIVPLVLIIFAIVAGTAATAGEESAGTMELLLAQPIRRRRLIIEKSLGISAAVTVALLAGIPGVLVGKLLVDFDLSTVHTIAGFLVTVPLLLLFVSIAVLTGAWFPTRALAVVVTTAAAVGAYVIHTIGLMVEQLEQARKLTPFYWSDASKALTGDYQVWGSAALLVLSLGLFALAVAVFERRDIGSGSEEIQWRKLLRLGRPHEDASPVPAAET